MKKHAPPPQQLTPGLVPVPPAREQEQLLIDLIPSLPATSLLTNTVGRGQLAAAYATQHPDQPVTLFYADAFHAEQSRVAYFPPPGKLDICLATDPPEIEVGLAAMLVEMHGEAEFVRELLQSFHNRLQIGGELLAATDHPKDQWLHEQLQELFDKVTRVSHKKGMVYRAIKTAPLKKQRSFVSHFPCRDGDHLLQLQTRPGVFNHRSVDAGARALLSSVEVREGENVLDIGCGSGVVGLVLCKRVPSATVLAIDSHTRAVECTSASALKNETPQLIARVDPAHTSVPENQFDVVAMNPPYFSNFRIAELFLQTATRALKEGGRLYSVTKAPEWYLERMKDGWKNVVATQVKNYIVITAQRTRT